jgi:hypothetical protein
MTVRTSEYDGVTVFEVTDEVMDRSLYADVLNDGILLTIQHAGFKAGVYGQVILSLEDINSLTNMLNELDQWV